MAILADLIQRHIGVVLGGQHNGVHAAGLALIVIFHGDLGLSVGTQIVHQLHLADLQP